MPLTRLRNALIALLVTSVLTYVWWPTVVDLSARQRAYDAIQPGMTLGEVERLMRGSGKVGFVKVSGPPEYHAQQWKLHGFPQIYTWEDAYTEVTVRFQAPEPNPPVVVSVSRSPKARPDLNSLLFWRIVLGLFWLVTLMLLLWAALTPKPTTSAEPVEPTDGANPPPTLSAADTPQENS
jgi:hypothetical protein